MSWVTPIFAVLSQATLRHRPLLLWLGMLVLLLGFFYLYRALALARMRKFEEALKDRTAIKRTLDNGLILISTILDFAGREPTPGNEMAYIVTLPNMAAAAIAAGADGLIIEVHPDPETAMSDGYQSLTFDTFAATMELCRKVARAMGRQIG